MVPDADGFADDTGDDRLGAGGLLDEAVTGADLFGGDVLTDQTAGDAALTARIRRRSPGSLEAEILNVLHTARRELSPGQVRERLVSGATLSYSAVVTTLTRLHGKGVVTRRRAGRAFLYLAESDAASLVAWRMNRLLDEQADHRPALTHFVAALSPGDEALIRQLLTESLADPVPPSTGHAPGQGGPDGAAGRAPHNGQDAGETGPWDRRHGSGDGRAPAGH
ncbi:MULTISPECIES: BlaI/MecI/CopY family transcriptional regulator [unclassified Pseudofrankia]|uniref:BlaI/MecI/CopY family transcriptional regulator n=1 Tax=unclassified Pseudofrankia TaxID=2994372 RepID=UPI001F5275CC|nr:MULTISPECIES: BlaI/MecI/CopY family transcriptional regulator [unclassified Pseudofrankia]MDT3440420.1 BlaI/MecI/CopY family transcriptional regulator [Pseudofrankia sp. BMG5.37]